MKLPNTLEEFTVFALEYRSTGVNFLWYWRKHNPDKSPDEFKSWVIKTATTFPDLTHIELLSESHELLGKSYCVHFAGVEICNVLEIENDLFHEVDKLYCNRYHISNN